MRHPLLAATLASLVLLVGCSSKKSDAEAPPTDGDTDDVVAQDGAETSAVETDSELLTSSFVGGAAGGLSLASAQPDLSTSGIGDGTKLLFFPRGCLAIASDETNRTVTYDFSDCTGPNGLFKIQGRVTATYTASANELALDLVGTNLRMNKATVDWSAHARITADGSKRTMEWRAQLTGTTARGREIARSNQKTIGWELGERCIAIAGVSEGKVKDRDLRTEIKDYRRCQGACPAAGGSIAISNGKKVITITFDGTDRGTITGPKGSATFPLACTE